MTTPIEPAACTCDEDWSQKRKKYIYVILILCILLLIALLKPCSNGLALETPQVVDEESERPRLEGNASDARLKTDIQLVETLENGIELYRFRYLGDSQYFVGVIAQQIASDPEHSKAVHTVDGFLVVDYEALGVPIADSAVMRKAGQQAILRQLEQ